MHELLTIAVFLGATIDLHLCGVSSFGETCNFTAECNDHRMVCLPDQWNISKCECDRFHEWQGVENGCILAVDIETILNLTLVSTDHQAELEKAHARVYLGHKVAGFFVMTMALLCPIVVAIHCCHMRRKDQQLQREVEKMRENFEHVRNKKSFQSLA